MPLWIIRLRKILKIGCSFRTNYNQLICQKGKHLKETDTKLFFVLYLISLPEIQDPLHLSWTFLLTLNRFLFFLNTWRLLLCWYISCIYEFSEHLYHRTKPLHITEILLGIIFSKKINYIFHLAIYVYIDFNHSLCYPNRIPMCPNTVCLWL